MDMQRKSIDNFDFKVKDDKGEMTFEGYLSIFGNVDSYGDIVVKGAFSKSLSVASENGKVFPVLEQHGAYHINSTDVTPIGYYSELSEDERGLKVKGVLFPTDRGKDVYAILKNSPKGFMGMSIGYRVIKCRVATRDEYMTYGVSQYLEELELMEGSIVTFPANTEARVESVKSLNVLEIRTLEKELTDNGFSRNDAKKCVSIFKSCMCGDNEDSEEKKEDISVLIDFVKQWKEEEEKRSLESLKMVLNGE